MYICIYSIIIIGYAVRPGDWYCGQGHQGVFLFCFEDLVNRKMPPQLFHTTVLPLDIFIPSFLFLSLYPQCLLSPFNLLPCVSFMIFLTHLTPDSLFYLCFLPIFVSFLSCSLLSLSQFSTSFTIHIYLSTLSLSSFFLYFIHHHSPPAIPLSTPYVQLHFLLHRSSTSDDV